MASYEEATDRYKGIRRFLDRFIPKLESESIAGKSVRQVHDEKIALAVAVKDYMESGDAFRLREIISG